MREIPSKLKVPKVNATRFGSEFFSGRRAPPPPPPAGVAWGCVPPDFSRSGPGERTSGKVVDVTPGLRFLLSARIAREDRERGGGRREGRKQGKVPQGK